MHQTLQQLTSAASHCREALRDAAEAEERELDAAADQRILEAKSAVEQAAQNLLNASWTSDAFINAEYEKAAEKLRRKVKDPRLLAKKLARAAELRDNRLRNAAHKKANQTRQGIPREYRKEIREVERIKAPLEEALFRAERELEAAERERWTLPSAGDLLQQQIINAVSR